MGTLYNNANLIIQADILSNLCLTEQIFDNLPQLANFFKELGNLPISNEIYHSNNLWCLLSLLKQIKIDSLLINIQLTALEYNMLFHKIYYNNIRNDNSCNINNNQSPPFIREIVQNGDDTKIIITKEKDPITNEYKEVSRKTVHRPDLNNLDAVFQGLLVNDIKTEKED